MKYLVIFLAAFSLIFASCGKKGGTGTNEVSLNGAGASFPFPIYSKWFGEYQKINKEIKINYQSIGSGGGIKQLTEGTVDFGGTDSPMKTEELSAAESKNQSKVIHIPTVIGAVVITYNLPGVEKDLNFTSDIIAEIYLGKIKKWNDNKIKSINSDAELPDKDIVPVHRTDGSGTTYVFTDYLSKTNEEWKTGPGVGKEVKFPVGQGAKGNEGVTGQVKNLEYSLGYVELVYALQNNLKYANIKNENGDFVKPTLESVTKAAEVMADQMPENLTLSITNAKGPGAYPISSYTYIIFFENQKDEAKGKALKNFLKWALTEGGKYALELGYSPLPKSVVEKSIEKLEIMNFNGKPL